MERIMGKNSTMSYCALNETTVFRIKASIPSSPVSEFFETNSAMLAEREAERLKAAGYTLVITRDDTGQLSPRT